jgi:hypothetical protein
MSAQFLSPPLACKFLLDEFGIKRTPATLAKLRVIGGNAPPYRKLGRSVYYALNDLSDWATGALNTRHCTTSDRLLSDSEARLTRSQPRIGEVQARNAESDVLPKGAA